MKGRPRLPTHQSLELLFAAATNSSVNFETWDANVFRESNGHRLATVDGSDGEKNCVRRSRYRNLIKDGSRSHPRQLSRDLTGKLGRAGAGGERIDESLRIAFDVRRVDENLGTRPILGFLA